MRTIKFRGKDRKTNEWFFGNLYDKDNQGCTHICTTSRGSLDVIPNTVGQFTGLTDKNGKDIYEGDILRSEEYPFNCDGVDNYYIVIEEIDNDGFLTIAPISRQSAISTCQGISDGFERDWSEVKNTEIIGNIHDNKELLKDYEL